MQSYIAIVNCDEMIPIDLYFRMNTPQILQACPEVNAGLVMKQILQVIHQSAHCADGALDFNALADSAISNLAWYIEEIPEARLLQDYHQVIWHNESMRLFQPNFTQLVINATARLHSELKNITVQCRAVDFGWREPQIVGQCSFLVNVFSE